MLLDGAPRPAAIVGCPVGFIGAAESKDALASLAADHGIDVPFLTVRGRRGGSAVRARAPHAHVDGHCYRRRRHPDAPSPPHRLIPGMDDERPAAPRRALARAAPRRALARAAPRRALAREGRRP